MNKLIEKKISKNILLLFACLIFILNPINAGEVTGNLRIWHKVSVTFDGPNVNESESTYRNYRLDVTFTKGSKIFKVPGYFAADGNAGETSASSGNKWRVNFTPDEAGTWNYLVSFRQGTDIAISTLATAGTAVAGVDGETGSFTIAPADANEQGFYAKGMLKYVGEHYGQFAGDKEWHVKAGPGSPEDFFGYKDFDNTIDHPNRSSSTQVQDVYLRNLNGEGLHYYTAHVNDWKPTDVTWKGGKGKGIIGALNYMASIGVNSLYMIPLTVNDDSDNTYPWTARDAHMSYDVSKLDQWDIVFSHMDQVGISSTYYLCENVNSKLLDNGNMVLKYPIYYREIIARFGYHLGIRFNLGEETAMSKEQQSAASLVLSNLDPYNKIIAGHSSHVRSDHVPVFEYLLGRTHYDGPNYQLHQNENRDHLDLILWRNQSAAAGHKWIVANDESWGINNSTGSTGEGRMLTYAWRTYMAGAEGMFQYTAYGTPEIGDITMENFRLIENTQKLQIACKNLFLKPEINPILHQMKNENALVGNPTGNDAPFCYAKRGENYIVFRTSQSNQTALNLSGESGTFSVKWYDARNGGNFQNGTVTSVNGGGSVSLGNPPSNPTGPWAIMIYKECANQKLIALTATGCSGSTVTGGNSYCTGTSASVTASPGAGCVFTNWTENGVAVSSANPYTFTVVGDRQLVANFASDATCSITATTDGCAGTTTTITGNNSCGNTIAVSANSGSDCVFSNWTENGIAVSTQNPYSFSISQSRQLIANFVPVKKQITLSINNATSGTVVGEGLYNPGQSITVSATTNPCYKFDNWTENNVVVSTSANYTFVVSQPRDLIANFSIKSYTVIADPLIGGTVTGQTSYRCGDVINITATPNPCYKFDGWVVNNNIISVIPTDDINISDDFQLYAKFSPIKYQINLSTNGDTGGTVTGTGSYDCNQSINACAIAQPGYKFDDWTENGVIVSTSLCYSFTVSQARNLVANFTLIQTYPISLAANNDAGGTVSGGGTFPENQQITAVATVASGYRFDNWTENGNVVSTALNYTFTVTQARSLVANFTLLPTYQISLAANNDAGGTVSGGGTFPENQQITAVATVASGYRFDNWTENGNVVSTALNYTFTVTQARSLVANFMLLPCTSTISATSNTLCAGTNLVLTATSGASYEWFKDDVQVGTQSTFTATAAGTYKVIVTNSFGCIATSPNFVITNANCPSISFSSPLNNANTGKSINVTVVNNNASFPLSNIVLFLDGVRVRQENVAPYEWKSTQDVVLANLSTGSHILRAVATTTSGQIVETSITINVLNTTPTCLVTATTNGCANSTVTITGTNSCGNSITLRANPASGCSFTNWTENGNVVSSQNPFSFTVNVNRQLVANFATIPTFQITTLVNGGIGGTVSGNGTFQQGQQITVTATPSTGYKFDNWTENGNVVSNNASYVFMVTQTRSLVANFSLLPCTASITAPSTSFCTGSSLVLTASAGATYQWFRDNVQVGTQRTFTATLAGTYKVVVTNVAGCIATSANFVATTTNCSGPSISFSNPLNNANTGRNIVVTVINNNLSIALSNVILYLDGVIVRQESVTPYVWNSTNGGSLDPKLNNLSLGSHQLRAVATATNGQKAEATITINVVSAYSSRGLPLESSKNDDDILVYPIPFQNNLTIETSMDNPIISVDLFDLIGKSIEILPKKHGLSKIDLSDNLPVGMFFLKIVSKNKTILRKIIKDI